MAAAFAMIVYAGLPDRYDIACGGLRLCSFGDAGSERRKLFDASRSSLGNNHRRSARPDNGNDHLSAPNDKSSVERGLSRRTICLCTRRLDQAKVQFG